MVTKRARSRQAVPARRYRWEDLDEEDLLQLKFRQLRLQLKDSPAWAEVRRLYAELERRGIRFRPHVWLAEEWFSPDGVPGIAIPFYVAHPRLRELERRYMGEVEGGSRKWLIRILRHEAAHALDTAYGLRRRAEWRRVFGFASKPYPGDYTPRPSSRRHVLHLGHWYAQSHPTEDFAETFAVWLGPKARWRRDYEGWPALRKLEYVDETMQELRGRRPVVRARHHVEPIRIARRTLRQHYAAMVRHYRSDDVEKIDNILCRVFTTRRSRAGQLRASRFLRENAPLLRRRVASRLDATEYLVQEMLDHLIDRSRRMRLLVRGEKRKALRRVERLLVTLTRKAQKGVGPWIAL